jgi:Na+-transporting methylmalonyl-CoA/oxaloacetate decarboxylase gamma subunit
MNSKNAKRNYFVAALALAYVLIGLYVAFCLDANYLIFSKKNPIAGFGRMLGLSTIAAEPSTWVLCLFFFIFFLAAVGAIMRILSRFAKSQKTRDSTKTVLECVAIAFGALVLAVGFGNLASLSGGSNLYLANLTFLGNVILISLLLFVAAFVLFIAAYSLLKAIILSFAKNRPDEKEADRPTEEADAENEKAADHDIASSFAPLAPGASVGAVSAPGGFAASSGSALPQKEILFKELSSIDDRSLNAPMIRGDGGKVSLSSFVDDLRDYLASSHGLFYRRRDLALFVSAFAVSHLVVLEGVSGTGKSSLPRFFASFIGQKAFFESVQMTFKEKSDLLGYYNEFTGTYMETDFLKQLYAASLSRDQIQLMVLDEMNISRVEYYFADFLSVMEFPPEERKITLMQLPENYDAPENLKDGVLSLTPNVFFVGTCNEDDSTFTVTDKVIDRSIVIDFPTRQDPFEPKRSPSPSVLTYPELMSLFAGAKKKEENALGEADENKFVALLDFTQDEFGLTIGNRVLNQIDGMAPVFVAAGESKEALLDNFFFSKVIRKLSSVGAVSLRDSLPRLEAKILDLFGESMPLSLSAVRRLEKRL